MVSRSDGTARRDARVAGISPARRGRGGISGAARPRAGQDGVLTPRPAMKDPRRFLLLLIIGVLAGYGWWRYEHWSRNSEKFTPAAGPKLSLEDVKVLAAIDAEYTKLIESVVPSVVSI